MATTPRYRQPSTPSRRTAATAIWSTFYLYIMRLYNRGLVNGYYDHAHCAATGSPCFLPNNPVTRGQAAKIVSNGRGYNEPAPATPTFEDVPTTDPFYVYVERLSLHGVISGYECGVVPPIINPCTGLAETCDALGRPYYRPCATLTRGQAAKLVANSFFPECHGLR
ncbi:MAG: S-layer homology domain-containing protein [Chloroflexia bacterium]